MTRSLPSTEVSQEPCAALSVSSGWALRLRSEHERAKHSGNQTYITTSGLRVAVCSGDPQKVAEYLLNEMGIKGDVKPDSEGILIGFGRFNHHAHATVLRALQGQFRVLCAMLENGSQALKIYL